MRAPAPAAVDAVWAAVEPPAPPRPQPPVRGGGGYNGTLAGRVRTWPGSWCRS